MAYSPEDFEKWVEEYSERLYWHLRSFVSCHEQADDLLQDSFVKAWRGLSSFRGECSPYTWLYRISTNVALNFLRKQKWEALLTRENLDAVIENMIDEDPSFDGDKAERELMKAVAKLSPLQKMVFCIRYFEDKSYEEIASAVGSSAGSLKVTYHNAVINLKKSLGDSIDLPQS